MKDGIKVVFFDLGNTLIYDDPAAWSEVYRRANDSLMDSLNKFGIDTSSRSIFGKHGTLLEYYYDLREGDLEEPGIGVVLKDILKGHHLALSDDNLHAALRSMYAVTQTNWFLEEDAVATLQILADRHYRLGIISNGSDDLNTFELLEKVGIRSSFEFIISSASFGKRKPHPDIFRRALDHFRIPPDRTVMVGDNYDADILGPRRLGMNTIWITRRLSPIPGGPSLRGETVVTTLSEIPDLLTQ